MQISLLWLLFLVLAFQVPLFGADSKISPAQELVLKLKDKDPGVRRKAAETLGSLRDYGTTDALIQALLDPDSAVRRQVIESLGYLRAQAAGKPIALLLETDKDASIRHQCATSLGYISDRNTINSLIKGVKDPDEGTRLACVNSLAILRDGGAVETLAQELKNKDKRFRNSVAYALGQIADRKAVPALKESLKLSLTTSPAVGNEYLMDPLIGSTIIRSLGLIGDNSAVESIKPHLKNDFKNVEIEASYALYRLGDGSGVGVARNFLKSTEARFRKAALDILGEFGDEKDQSKMKAMLNDPEKSVQESARNAINRYSGRKTAKTQAKTKSAPGKVSPAKNTTKTTPAKKGQ